MSDSTRTPLPRTSQPNAHDTSSLQLSNDQTKQFELHRLKAKALQREREEATAASSSTNSNNKRPLGVISATNASPTAPSKQKDGKLQRDSRLGTYFEYDLSKMVNSKGGFLVADDKEVDEAFVRKEKQREMERTKQTLAEPVYLEPQRNSQCRDCGSIDIDLTFKKIFRCLVCKKCQNDHPEKYSLLTKTECKEDYLLTDPELRDHDIMPHLLKANPHHSTYSNMMLFCRFQVEEFAWKKWGSPEALDAEYEKRIEEKKKKKNKKFEESLKDLRRRTKEGVWQKRKDAEHRHSFGPSARAADGSTKQICHECGFTIEFEEL